jgi:hypothetical protein
MQELQLVPRLGASWDDVRLCTTKDEGVDGRSALDARVVEFTRLVAGYALDFDDMEVIPATATSKAMISIAGLSVPAEYLYGTWTKQPHVSA